MNWLTHLEGLTIIAPIATAIGFAIAYFVSREYIKQTIATLKGTIVSQELNLNSKDELASSLAATHDAIIASLEAKLGTMTEERNKYREDLHATREPMQVLSLKVQEFELRPDLNRVLQQEEQWHERREKFYLAMADSQKAILDAQRDTVKLIQISQRESTASLTRNYDAFKAVIEHMEEKDKHLYGVLEKILEQLAENARLNAEAQTKIRPVLVKNDEDNRVPVAPPNPKYVSET